MYLRSFLNLLKNYNSNLLAMKPQIRAFDCLLSACFIRISTT